MLPTDLETEGLGSSVQGLSGLGLPVTFKALEERVSLWTAPYYS